MDDTESGFAVLLREAERIVLSPNLQFQNTAAEEPLLNGMPSRVFRQSVDINDRRDAGAFFSGAKIAEQLARLLLLKVPRTSRVMDPTCGIGDLLLAYAAGLPIETTLERTLERWGKLLMGMDKQPDLVRLAKLRLAMLARYRGRFSCELSNIDQFFPHITVGDIFENISALKAADGFLFNPPFGQAAHPLAENWTSGLANSAAVFLDFLIQEKKTSAPIAAVLPEVLRCGSRYLRFRNHVESMGISGTYFSLGRFDTWTDVDVFGTLLTSSAPARVWVVAGKTSATKVVQDYFEVRVGPVVPHRHGQVGPWRKYICARTTPAWSGGFTPQVSRRFKGTVFEPPFVVVRRTSSPSDRQRAVGAIVIGDRAVAVENHLLVLKPRDNNVITCQELVEVLKQPHTIDHLNETIRCRHLTTRVVANIPWTVGDV